jgi:hypothetical protein
LARTLTVLFTHKFPLFIFKFHFNMGHAALDKFFAYNKPDRTPDSAAG